ncbi:hypothetical protein ACOXXX_10695 [Thalassococcus sp. BH17M4-6]|uniref:hypothetical protein n=1 Tax=Thalassococcus sp. BH17M4-6 TaxID=3413148 RepID=UPI003BE73FA5
MKSLISLRNCLLALTLLALSACASPPVGPAAQPDAQKIESLARAIVALGPEIDPEEARRAARVAVEYPRRLMVEYQITDPPLRHNMKVNAGLKPRGLCWHWARDLGARMEQEDFQSLDILHAIANYKVPFRIEHSSIIIAARGDDIYDGLVLDPWRYGGTLYYGPTLQDELYPWRPRAEVFAEKRRDKGEDLGEPVTGF